MGQETNPLTRQLAILWLFIATRGITPFTPSLSISCYIVHNGGLMRPQSVPYVNYPRADFGRGKLSINCSGTLCFAPIVEIDNSCSFSSLTNWSWKSLVFYFLVVDGHSLCVQYFYWMIFLCHVKSISPCDNHVMWPTVKSHLLQACKRTDELSNYITEWALNV